MYYVYILQSQKGKGLYIGYTSDLEKRVNDHNAGRNISTKPFRPYVMIFYEAFTDKKDAMAREEYLKSGWGFRTIKKMLKNYLS
jgi:putative endonuclease